MSDLIDTTEMYLRTIYELEEEGITPLRARIAERLGHSGPTVSQTVARMERDGLVRVTGERHLDLTEAGRSRAVRVMRKHRLAERLLVDVIGLEWEFVHDEACRWEHVMSERVERKVVAMLTPPLESPYGNPIPGLDELGAAIGSRAFRDGVRNLVETVKESPERELIVRRLGEPVQTNSELMAAFARAGVRPGAALTAARRAGGITIQCGEAQLLLEDAVASHVFVDGT